jgi:hypothetical protein
VTLGSEEAGPVAVCDTAGPLSNAVDKIATADEAAKLDLMTYSLNCEPGTSSPKVAGHHRILKKGKGALKEFCRSLAIDMAAERTRTALTVDDQNSGAKSIAVYVDSQLHYVARHARNVIIAGVVGALVSGCVWAFWVGFKANAAAPSSTISAPSGPGKRKLLHRENYANVHLNNLQASLFASHATLSRLLSRRQWLYLFCRGSSLRKRRAGQRAGFAACRAPRSGALAGGALCREI